VVVLCEFAFNGDGAVEIGSGNGSNQNYLSICIYKILARSLHKLLSMKGIGR
jgi:hypothetical protein